MKKFAFPLLFLLFTCSLQAQTKVFKEVSEEISTQMKPITQDNALVGYPGVKISDVEKNPDAAMATSRNTSFQPA